MGGTREIGIVGAGLMGAGIAYEVARHLDARVRLVDVSEEYLKRGLDRITTFKERAVRKKLASSEEAARWMTRIVTSTDMKSLATSALVIEAVPEQMALKKEVFGELDRICRDATFLASNTSSLPISTIATATSSPRRVVGTHFFNPVPAINLVEIVRGKETAPGVVTAAQEFCRSLGKETIVVRDSPGFVTSRIGQAFILEGIRCLADNVATAEDIDKGMRLAHNYPMGPLELADLIGLDTELNILQFLHAELGERYKPHPLLTSLVTAGHLGRKTGKGFYTYP